MNLCKPYPIIAPSISTGSIYYFTTDKGIKYEVRFGRKQNNILHATIVFGVINEEFEGEEYSETNKGEIYRVMSTVVTIVNTFIHEHAKVNTYEFTGITRDTESDKNSSVRINLYKRYLPFIANPPWSFKMANNTIIIYRD